MRARPIIFSAPMIRALLGGRKTQTRRIVRKPERYERIHECAFCCPYGQPGDLLYVREAWRTESDAYNDLSPSQLSGDETLLYSADADWSANHTVGRVRAAMHMPRWASRITLRLTDVRVERLQEISEEDAMAEGVRPDDDMRWNPVQAYEHLWESINGPGSWDANPWVWALSFQVLKQNIDEVSP